MKVLSIATIAIFLAGFAGAAEDSTVKSVPVGNPAEQQVKPLGTPVDTFGKVTSLHICPMVGTAAPHMIVKLETEQGDTEIVDLGSAAELKSNNIEPKEGKTLWVDGRVGKINDKFLIVAEEVSESKLVSIPRTVGLNEETVKHADAAKDGKTGNEAKEVKDTKDPNAAKDGKAGDEAKEVKDTKDPNAAKTETVDAGSQVRTVEGTVIHTRHVKIEGEADEHVLAKIKTSTGIAVIDLGTCPAMPNSVNLTEGQPIVATGTVGQLNGKPIIYADSVGNMSTIQRPADRQTVPASATTTRDK